MIEKCNRGDSSRIRSEDPSTPGSTGDTETPARATATATGDPGFATVLHSFLRLGTLGFGGPIAVVGYMQRGLVEKRGWIAKQDFLNGVALEQTMPGPLAAQVAMWVGYLRRGVLGAAATALAFIAPSFLMVTAVAVAYAHYPGLRVPLAHPLIPTKRPG
ncbi:chromate transporter [Streptomyces sp. A1-5]|uniref:chromate transporter n=1 Tax=Streptomyces sp. A1-5 TaxID=2738410 RepID=UPI001F182B84|nr:chromate transporter [Streptomyces sp. A1-5]UJB44473.1 chromate transporter [Streptomyces sp. A1-5]